MTFQIGIGSIASTPRSDRRRDHSRPRVLQPPVDFRKPDTIPLEADQLDEERAYVEQIRTKTSSESLSSWLGSSSDAPIAASSATVASTSGRAAPTPRW